MSVGTVDFVDGIQGVESICGGRKAIDLQHPLVMSL